MGKMKEWRRMSPGKGLGRQLRNMRSMFGTTKPLMTPLMGALMTNAGIKLEPKKENVVESNQTDA